MTALRELAEDWRTRSSNLTVDPKDKRRCAIGQAYLDCADELLAILEAYAERIQADEREVPFGYVSRNVAPFRTGTPAWQFSLTKVEPHGCIEAMPLFTHPPAHAAHGEAAIDRAVLAYRMGCTGSVEGHNHRAGLAAVIEALANQPRAVPDGWVLVPVRPDMKMSRAAHAAWERVMSMGALRPNDTTMPFVMWDAMLTAAPSPGESV